MSTTECTCDNDGFGRMTWGMVALAHVIGRDRKRGRVLLGGLGALGLGIMWTDATALDQERPGWDDAPEIDEAKDVAAHGTLGGSRIVVRDQTTSNDTLTQVLDSTEGA